MKILFSILVWIIIFVWFIWIVRINKQKKFSLCSTSSRGGDSRPLPLVFIYIELGRLEKFRFREERYLRRFFENKIGAGTLLSLVIKISIFICFRQNWKFFYFSRTWNRNLFNLYSNFKNWIFWLLEKIVKVHEKNFDPEKI